MHPQCDRVALRTGREDTVPIQIRTATVEDAKAIKRLICRVGINPFGLDWQRFLVAEDAGEIVGCIQVKPYQDGVRELASLAVVPERQGQGVGTLLVNALLARDPGELYLMCLDVMGPYYARFNFGCRTSAHPTQPQAFLSNWTIHGAALWQPTDHDHAPT